MTAGPAITVVIPTWNGADRIDATIESLARQDLDAERFEILVVDDGSRDGTCDRVHLIRRSLPLPHLRCVRIPHAGVNAARNAGIRGARGTIVAFLDDDEVAERDYLVRVLELIDEPGPTRWPGVGGPYFSADAAFRTCHRCSIGDAVLPIEGRGPSPRLLGGNMAIRRKVFDEVGLFDPEISGRGDETEWFARAGREFLYDERLAIWHRRDHLTLAQLLANGFHQGRSVPLLHEKLGDAEWSPSVQKLGRYVGHAVRARCTNGILQGSRELGALSSWFTWQRVRSRLTSRAGTTGAMESTTEG